MEKVINAKDKTIGRVATEAAMALMGKDKANYKPNAVAEISVKIENASETKITEKKKGEKQYTRYSGHPGGLKHDSLSKVLKEKGYGEVYKRAVRGMLPANKLRDLRLKNLVVID